VGVRLRMVGRRRICRVCRFWFFLGIFRRFGCLSSIWRLLLLFFGCLIFLAWLFLEKWLFKIFGALI